MATALTIGCAGMVLGLFWAFWRGAHSLPGYSDEWTDDEK